LIDPDAATKKQKKDFYDEKKLQVGDERAEGIYVRVFGKTPYWLTYYWQDWKQQQARKGWKK
jgi:hypothetical protein